VPEEPEMECVVFEDELLEQYCIDNYDADNDGKISKEVEALNVKEIRFEEDDVLTSLEDIAYFPNLEILSVKSGTFTEVDLSMNKALTDLWLSSVPLKTLDLSNNKKLKTLVCYQTGLRVLDISMLAYLKQLSITPMTSTGELAYLLVSHQYQLDSIEIKEVSESTSVLVKGAIIVLVRSFDFTAEGGECNFTVCSAIDYKLSTLPEWIVLDDTVQVDEFTDRLYFKILSNVTDSGREAALNFTNPSGYVLATVSFRQEKPAEEDEGDSQDSVEGGNQDIVEGDDIIL